jgi:hypothetical protein
MTKKYEVIENDFGILIKMTAEDGVISFVPTDPANSDYRDYLKSLEDEA